MPNSVPSNGSMKCKICIAITNFFINSLCTKQYQTYYKTDKNYTAKAKGIYKENIYKIIETVEHLMTQGE